MGRIARFLFLYIPAGIFWLSFLAYGAIKGWDALVIDQCLDAGGRWKTEKSECQREMTLNEVLAAQDRGGALAGSFCDQDSDCTLMRRTCGPTVSVSLENVETFKKTQDYTAARVECDSPPAEPKYTARCIDRHCTAKEE